LLTFRLADVPDAVQAASAGRHRGGRPASLPGVLHAAPAASDSMPLAPPPPATVPQPGKWSWDSHSQPPGPSRGVCRPICFRV